MTFQSSRTRSSAPVIFLTDHQLGYLPGTQAPVAAGASARLRVILPSQGLRRLGWQTDILGLGIASKEAVIARSTTSHFVIVSKIFRRESLELIRRLKMTGVKLVIDFCDNHLDGGEFQEIHGELLRLATRCIANTPVMHRVLRQHGFVGPIHVIEDMIEHPRVDPRPLKSTGTLNLIAFGSKLVCRHLEAWLPALKAFSSKIRPINLEIVTLLDKETIRWELSHRGLIGDGFRYSLTQWNELGMEQPFRRADIAIIPSEEGTFTKTKSANRLLEATLAGLPVVAYPIEPYLPYRDIVAITKDVSFGLNHLLRDVDATRRRVFCTQVLASINHNHAQIALQWDKLIVSLSDQEASSMNKSIRTIRVILSTSTEKDELILEFHDGSSQSVDPRTHHGVTSSTSVTRYDNLVLELYHRFGAPDWVHFQSQDHGFASGNVRATRSTGWFVGEIQEMAVPVGSSLFKAGLLRSVSLVLEAMMNKSELTEYEHHEFLFNKYQIRDPWNSTIPGVVWVARATRLQALDTAIKETLVDSSHAMLLSAHMFNAMSSYLLIKHLSLHGLLRQFISDSKSSDLKQV